MTDMTKEILIGIFGGTIAVTGVLGVFIGAEVLKKSKKENKLDEEEKEIERIFVDELNVGEIKEWFAEKIVSDKTKGIILYPTKENIKKWKLKMPKCDNMLIQLIVDSDNDKVVARREIGFSVLSDKMKELLDSNGGTVVIE